MFKAINPKREIFDKDKLKQFYPYMIFKDDVIFLATLAKVTDTTLWFNYFKPDDENPTCLLEIKTNDDFDIYPLESIYDPAMVEALSSMRMLASIDFSIIKKCKSGSLANNLTDKEQE